MADTLLNCSTTCPRCFGDLQTLCDNPQPFDGDTLEMLQGSSGIDGSTLVNKPVPQPGGHGCDGMWWHGPHDGAWTHGCEHYGAWRRHALDLCPDSASTLPAADTRASAVAARLNAQNHEWRGMRPLLVFIIVAGAALATRFHAGASRPVQTPQLVSPFRAIDAPSRDTHGRRWGQLLRQRRAHIGAPFS